LPRYAAFTAVATFIHWDLSVSPVDCLTSKTYRCCVNLTAVVLCVRNDFYLSGKSLFYRFFNSPNDFFYFPIFELSISATVLHKCMYYHSSYTLKIGHASRGLSAIAELLVAICLS